MAMHRVEGMNKRTERRLATNKDSRQEIDHEMQQLESDIEELMTAIQQQRDRNRVYEAWQNYQSYKPVVNNNRDLSDAQIEGLKYQIDQLGDITGISLVDTKTDVLEKGKLWCKKKKVVEGYCGQVEFTLELDLEETMTDDTSVSSNITNMQISVSEEIQKDLGNTVKKLTKACNAQGFLQLLQPYNMWHKAREKVFQHCTETYPKVAKRKSAQLLHLTHPTKDVTFLIKWTFTVTDIYQVIPDIQLATQVPRHVSQLNNVLQDAPENFQLMLKELGIEMAINSLIVLLIK